MKKAQFEMAQKLKEHDAEKDPDKKAQMFEELQVKQKLINAMQKKYKEHYKKIHSHFKERNYNPYITPSSKEGKSYPKENLEGVKEALSKTYWKRDEYNNYELGEYASTKELFDAIADEFGYSYGGIRTIAENDTDRIIYMHDKKKVTSLDL